MGLILVAADREEILVRRRGRIDVPREQAKSMKHLLRAMREATATMVRDMKPRGFEWEPSYNLEFYGPFPHVVMSDDTSPDPGMELERFDPRDLERIRRVEDEQKRRKAQRADLNAARVDYEIVAVFRTKQTPYQRVVGGSNVWVPS